MANTTKITLITLENQRLYDGLIKKYIGTQISNAKQSTLSIQEWLLWWWTIRD